MARAYVVLSEALGGKIERVVARDYVILSEAKDLSYEGTRFFASLRMTAASLVDWSS